MWTVMNHINSLFNTGGWNDFFSICFVKDWTVESPKLDLPIFITLHTVCGDLNPISVTGIQIEQCNCTIKLTKTILEKSMQKKF